MPKQSRKLLEQVDVCLSKATIKQEVIPNLRYESSYSIGDVVEIAYSIMTPSGQHYRIKGTSRWLSSEQVDLETQSVPFTDYRFKESPNSAILNKGKELNISSNNINSKPKRKTVTKTMDKLQVRKLIDSVAPGDKISFNFAGDLSESSGEFKVLKVRPGRGKGGSLLIELQAADGSLITTGTPYSEKIINITTVDGTVHGLSSESELRTVYSVDISRAVALKEQFKTLQTMTTGDTVIEVESTEPSIAGKFKIVSSKQLRGRFGQIVLGLVSVETGESQELWSYRHSGVITRISVL